MRKTRKKAGFIADNKYLSLQIFENEKEEEEELFLVESIEKFHDFFFAFKSVAVIVVEAARPEDSTIFVPPVILCPTHYLFTQIICRSIS